MFLYYFLHFRLEKRIITKKEEIMMTARGREGGREGEREGGRREEREGKRK